MPEVVNTPPAKAGYSYRDMIAEESAHYHSRICCAAVIGKPVICHHGGH